MILFMLQTIAVFMELLLLQNTYLKKKEEKEKQKEMEKELELEKQKEKEKEENKFLPKNFDRGQYFNIGPYLKDTEYALNQRACNLDASVPVDVYMRSNI